MKLINKTIRLLAFVFVLFNKLYFRKNKISANKFEGREKPDFLRKIATRVIQ